MHFENPRLFCDYFTNDNPGLLLMPVRREVLSLQPYVVLYHNFITDTEAEDIKRLAQPGVSASTVHSPHNLLVETKPLSCHVCTINNMHFLVNRIASSDGFVILSFPNKQKECTVSSTWDSQKVKLQNLFLARPQAQKRLFVVVCCVC